ncbi:hypothetical protein JXL21_10345 [Candidatus Bathyarchaeota archaeon]|nr:hypothetical protein [Candidatus Bathyarchaeota archaeon]
MRRSSAGWTPSRRSREPRRAGDALDPKALFIRVLPYWTLLNLGLTGVSVVSAVILLVTETLLPVTESILQLTVVSLINMVFLLYWSLWFVTAAPPILGSLYLSRENPDYYRYAVQNTAAVLVLYALKIVFRFVIFTVVG